MNWQHLIYFKTLAEEGTYAKAAAKMFITPPALSKAIASLESEIGVKLFEHTTAGSVLTKYGSIFYDGVNVASSKIDSSLMDIRFATNPGSVRLRIGSSYNTLVSFIPKCVGAFQQQYSEAQFDIKYFPGNKIIKDLAYGDLDVGFCNCFEKYSDELERLPNVAYMRLARKKLYVICPKDNHLTKRSSVSIKDLENENWILASGQEDNAFIQELCTSAGFLPNVKLWVYDRLSAMSLVRAGLGITVLSFSHVTKPEGYSIVPIDVDYDKTEFVVWNKNNKNEAVRSFINTALKLAGVDENGMMK